MTTVLKCASRRRTAIRSMDACIAIIQKYKKSIELGARKTVLFVTQPPGWVQYVEPRKPGSLPCECLIFSGIHCSTSSPRLLRTDQCPSTSYVPSVARHPFGLRLPRNDPSLEVGLSDDRASAPWRPCTNHLRHTIQNEARSHAKWAAAAASLQPLFQKLRCLYIFPMLRA